MTLINEDNLFSTFDVNTVKNLPYEKWPKFTAEGIKDGKPLKLTWVAGYFETTDNDGYDRLLEQLVTTPLEAPTIPLMNPHSPMLSIHVPIKFFDQDTIWDEEKDDFSVKYEFFNMPDPVKLWYSMMPDEPGVFY